LSEQFDREGQPRKHAGGGFTDCGKDADPLRFAQLCGNDDKVELLGTQKNLSFRHSGCLRFIPSPSEDGTASVQEPWVLSRAKEAGRIRGHRESSSLVIEDLTQNGHFESEVAANDGY
jgi:hypothetical protein